MMLGSINCFIIENDPIALFWLQKTLQDFIDVEICGFAMSKEEALKKMKSVEIDLVLADIELDEGTSFELLEALEEVPQFGIIFITAHTHYALQAIKMNAIDYVIKPIDVQELRNAINRFKANQTQKLTQLKKLLSYLDKDNLKKRLSLPLKTHTELVDLNDIIYFKADSNYCYVYLKNSEIILVSKTLKEFVNQLATNSSFFRVHQSYLVNINYIKKIIKTKLPQIVMYNDDILTVSRSKKTAFLAIISMQ